MAQALTDTAFADPNDTQQPNAPQQGGAGKKPDGVPLMTPTPALPVQQTQQAPQVTPAAGPPPIAPPLPDPNAGVGGQVTGFAGANPYPFMTASGGASTPGLPNPTGGTVPTVAQNGGGSSMAGLPPVVGPGPGGSGGPNAGSGFENGDAPPPVGAATPAAAALRDLSTAQFDGANAITDYTPQELAALNAKYGRGEHMTNGTPDDPYFDARNQYSLDHTPWGSPTGSKAWQAWDKGQDWSGLYDPAEAQRSTDFSQSVADAAQGIHPNAALMAQVGIQEQDPNAGYNVTDPKNPVALSQADIRAKYYPQAASPSGTPQTGGLDNLGPRPGVDANGNAIETNQVFGGYPPIGDNGSNGGPAGPGGGPRGVADYDPTDYRPGGGAGGGGTPPIAGSPGSSGGAGGAGGAPLIGDSTQYGSLAGSDTPGGNYLGQTIQPGPGVDREKLAESNWENFTKATDPYYQKSLRDARSNAAGAGQLGSGQFRTSLGDLANQRNIQLDTEKQSLLNDATSGSIGDQFAKLGIAQQQQGFQAGQQNTAFNQALQQQYLQEALQQGDYSRALGLLSAGEQGNPSSTALGLSGLYGNQASAAGAGAAGLIGNAANANNQRQQTAMMQQLLASMGYGAGAGGGGNGGGIDWGQILQQFGPQFAGAVGGAGQGGVQVTPNNTPTPPIIPTGPIYQPKYPGTN